MNWTAVIITLVACSTALAITDRMKTIAKIWLEGIRILRDTEAMRCGYPPKGGRGK